MNAYFLSMKPEERENILSQHREVYNGYQTLNPAAMESTQPLYTQETIKSFTYGVLAYIKDFVKIQRYTSLQEMQKHK
jgi:hypothetical protein